MSEVLAFYHYLNDLLDKTLSTVRAYCSHPSMFSDEGVAIHTPVREDVGRLLAEAISAHGFIANFKNDYINVRRDLDDLIKSIVLKDGKFSSRGETDVLKAHERADVDDPNEDADTHKDKEDTHDGEDDHEDEDGFLVCSYCKNDEYFSKTTNQCCDTCNSHHCNSDLCDKQCFQHDYCDDHRCGDCGEEAVDSGYCNSCL